MHMSRWGRIIRIEMKIRTIKIFIRFAVYFFLEYTSLVDLSEERERERSSSNQLLHLFFLIQAREEAWL